MTKPPVSMLPKPFSKLACEGWRHGHKCEHDRERASHLAQLRYKARMVNSQVAVVRSRWCQCRRNHSKSLPVKGGSMAGGIKRGVYGGKSQSIGRRNGTKGAWVRASHLAQWRQGARLACMSGRSQLVAAAVLVLRGPFCLTPLPPPSIPPPFTSHLAQWLPAAVSFPLPDATSQPLSLASPSSLAPSLHCHV